MMSKWLPMLVVLALGGGGEARADMKVDWSEYIEPAGSKPPAVKHQDLVSAAKPTKTARAAPVAAKPAAAKAKRKAPARHR